MKSPFLRDEFAKHAMQAIIVAGTIETKTLVPCEAVANLAYIFADAMLEQRQKETVDHRKKEEEKDGTL